MKEMIYKEKWGDKIEILACGVRGRYEWRVTSVGIHPCAYIKLPKNHPYTGFSYDNEEIYNIPVHGGITYAESYYPTENNSNSLNWVLGWDYGHYEDYTSTKCMFVDDGYKKWTTQEIVDEVLGVIFSLRSIKKEIYK